MLRPVRRNEASGSGWGEITPLNMGGDGRPAGGGDVRGPKEPSGRAAVGRFIQTPTYRMPYHRPPFHREVR